MPVFEVDYADANKMVTFIRNGTVVYIKATMDVTNADNTVEVDLWYSTSLDLGLNLSTELAAMSLSFSSDHAAKPLFTPRIATIPCENCSDDFKEKNCVSDGAFCGYTPAFYQEYGLEKKGFEITGRDIIV